MRLAKLVLGNPKVIYIHMLCKLQDRITSKIKSLMITLIPEDSETGLFLFLPNIVHSHLSKPALVSTSCLLRKSIHLTGVAYQDTDYTA